MSGRNTLNPVSILVNKSTEPDYKIKPENGKRNSEQMIIRSTSDWLQRRKKTEIYMYFIRSE